jgi:uncharacterized SAM-binding protein YcdF (DUF218 family)
MHPRSCRIPGGSVSTRPRWRPRPRHLLVSICLILATTIVAGVPVYVRPQVDPLRHADAILVLGGFGYERYPYGLELGDHGWAPIVVVSSPNGTKDVWLTKYCATPHPKFDLHCFVPDPPTTMGEGRELKRLAARHGWRTVIVVTYRPHISRARYILEQCFDGDLIMVVSPPGVSIPRFAYEYAYQTAGYVRAALQPVC